MSLLSWWDLVTLQGKAVISTQFSHCICTKFFSRLCQRFRHICQIPATVPESEGRREMAASGDEGLDCGHGHGPCVQMTSPCPRQQGAEPRRHLARSRQFGAFLWLDFLVGCKLAAPGAAQELIPTLSVESHSPSLWLCFWGSHPTSQ